MLVLSRKPGESFLIEDPKTGHTIRVTCVRIGPGTVRIGVDAPREMTILRDELAKLNVVDQDRQQAVS